jgi:PAS domain S-box-containing protein
MKGLELFVFPQMVFTIFLVALLWAFHARLRRQAFFWWWACGWTSFAVFLSLAALRMEVPRDWMLFRQGLALLMMPAGFIQVPFLLFGAWCLQSPAQPSRRWVAAGVALAVAAGLVGFAFSVFFRDLPLGSFTARNVARTLSLSAALLICAAMFFRRWRSTGSWAAGITGGFSLLYGLNQSIYTVSLVSYWALSPDALLRRLLDPMGIVQSQLFLVDLIASCGTCLGLVLMLVEEHQHAERALLESVSRGEEIALANATLRAEIAERLRIEEALRDSEDQQRAILKALPDRMHLITTDGVLLDYHARSSPNSSGPHEFLTGKHIRDLLPPDVASGLERCCAEAAISDEAATFEYAAPANGDGDMRFYEARVVRCDRDKFLSIIRDITERTRAENEVRGLRDALAHVGRVNTLGVMTGSLAHEINQPLAAISINAKAALNMAGNHTIDVSELQDAMREVIADAQRAGDVLYRLRKLLVRGITERTPLDVKTLVDEVLRLVKGEMIARRIVVDVDVEHGVPEVLGDRVQLQQVILNLLINAFEAVRQLDADDRRVTLRVAVDGSQVVVSVVDTGDGLSDPQIHEIFEPFYTTKDGGMGLGLTICRMIVTAHGGTLTAARNPKRGMTFSFCLDGAVATADLRSAQRSLQASPFA